MADKGSVAAKSLTNSAPLSIFSYCAASILMTVTNKYAVSGVDFNFNFFLLAVQGIVCITLISSLKQLNVITFREFNKVEAKKWFPIAVLLVVMIYTSSKALQYLSIPIYTIFKNLTIILIAYGEVIWFGGRVTNLALGSFVLMVLSSAVASYGDSNVDTGKLNFNIGYFWMFTNCFSSAAFVLFMRKRIKLTNFKDFDTMYYNNLLSIPILLFASLTTEDWSAKNIAQNFPEDTKYAVIASMIISGMSAVGISYTSAWCVRVTSSTTYSMVGALNKLPIALSGLLFFKAPINFYSISSIFIGFAAGLVYAIAKQKQKKEDELQLPTDKS
ncbi:Golgi GDP-mannose transporter [Komagataella phaffii CBS 7435]|uniref:GDP-mannose transporter n=3 Tax=Komagataella TaxID=460517 RepID=GMT_PICPA|nr:Golgi GDP-mannose transporter [Komagataella phaffii GS115]Q2AAF6.1 RecName: Full=GDP-mannose transporter; Short=GMT [Komagataella pastoris]AOA63680.1 GQ67_04039T0 [Komagataella phaffii]KAI0462450.1 GDP-mannose transporter [Komagataella kurtzmanii]CAH2449210.1 Golgi GDP-mannose transporter [Komagataella phaffii CBS 7435]AOA68307.1 GQ68_04012T0 [Komagataella phaffii GS115]CAY70975.1 Golgi GDP-mannose transporter [Komagataella phaffii GS115]